MSPRYLVSSFSTSECHEPDSGHGTDVAYSFPKSSLSRERARERPGERERGRGRREAQRACRRLREERLTTRSLRCSAVACVINGAFPQTILAASITLSLSPGLSLGP
jgi:hypothetical protein